MRISSRRSNAASGSTAEPDLHFCHRLACIFLADDQTQCQVQLRNLTYIFVVVVGWLAHFKPKIKRNARFNGGTRPTFLSKVGVRISSRRSNAMSGSTAEPDLHFCRRLACAFQADDQTQRQVQLRNLTYIFVVGWLAYFKPTFKRSVRFNCGT